MKSSWDSRSRVILPFNFNMIFVFWTFGPVSVLSHVNFSRNVPLNGRYLHILPHVEVSYDAFYKFLFAKKKLMTDYFKNQLRWFMHQEIFSVNLYLNTHKHQSSKCIT